QEPEVLKVVAGWAVQYSTVPVLVKLTPNIGDILEAGVPAVEAGVHGLSLINTIKSLIGVDLDRFVPYPVVGSRSTNGGSRGPRPPSRSRSTWSRHSLVTRASRFRSRGSAGSRPGATPQSSSPWARPASRCAPPPCTTGSASSRT